MDSYEIIEDRNDLNEDQHKKVKQSNQDFTNRLHTRCSLRHKIREKGKKWLEVRKKLQEERKKLQEERKKKLEGMRELQEERNKMLEEIRELHCLCLVVEQELAAEEKMQKSMREEVVHASWMYERVKVIENNILNRYYPRQAEGHHGVEMEGEQLRPKFSQTPDSIQINQKGKNVEVHNQEILQDKHVVISNLPSEAGRLAELNLAKKIRNQEMGSLEVNSSVNECIGTLLGHTSFVMEDGTGTSNAATNEVNVKMSPDEACIVQCYKDLTRENAIVLTEIFQEHPNTTDNFLFSCPHLQNYFMNLLAEIY